MCKKTISIRMIVTISNMFVSLTIYSVGVIRSVCHLSLKQVNYKYAPNKYSKQCILSLSISTIIMRNRTTWMDYQQLSKYTNNNYYN